MISFDLRCAGGHVFEGWFRSSADYDAQQDRRLISCPICGDADVGKSVMAPAVAPKGNRRAGPRVSTGVAMPGNEIDVGRLKAMMAELAQAQARMLEESQSQWVGADFAEQARAMHYGEAEQAAIHGTADPREARAMMEEGVPVAPLIVPVGPPGKTH